jgi:SNF2 family DNA or RNA helicase
MLPFGLISAAGVALNSPAWNPMDLEQRIGHIHRYGQVHTAQVYNLVSADTIEGQIFMLLE